MDMLNKAILIAIKAHKNPKDKGNNDYLNHPIYVALQMKTEEEKIVAILHDVIEDSNITLQDLKEQGFNNEIINAIDILTRKDNIDYFDYIKLVKTNTLARKVKLADLKHNLLEERLKNNNSWKNILFDKYNKAKQELEV